jgi:hypothetical protein
MTRPDLVHVPVPAVQAMKDESLLGICLYHVPHWVSALGAYYATTYDKVHTSTYKHYNFGFGLLSSASLARSIICRVTVAASARQRLNLSVLSLRLVIVHRMWSSPIE